MKYIRLSALLILLTACANTPISPFIEQYKHTQELEEKSLILESFLLHTYGPDNPFLELPYTVHWCIELSKQLTISGNSTHKENDLFVAAYSQESLVQLDRAVSTLLYCFVHDTPKESAFKELFAMTHEYTTWLTIHAPITALTSPYAKKITAHQKRFFMINPSIVGSAVHFLSLAAAGIWGLYTLKKIYSYLTAANHELINELEADQAEAKTELLALNNKVSALINKKAEEQGLPRISIPPIKDLGPQANPARHPFRFMKRAWKKFKNNRASKKQQKVLTAVIDDKELLKKFNTLMKEIGNLDST